MSCRGLSVSSNYAKAFWSPAFVGMWLCLMAAASANAANVMPEEKAAARQWFDAHFLKEGQLPFSFTYQGKPSAELLKSWKTERQQRELDANRVEHTIVWMDPETGLELRCVAIEYRDFPTVEWTLRFRNSGLQPTPILADIQGIDAQWQRPAAGEFTLHHNTGSPCSAHDYEPHVTPLGPKAAVRITTSGGRSTNSDLPYFNIEWPGGGAIVVLGWPGQWAAEFNRDEAAGLRVRGGQELTHFKLLPGEEVRSPLVVVQFWKGDRLRAHNVWRRWMLAHNTPHFDGKPMPPISIMCTCDFYPGMKSNAADEIKYADAYSNAGFNFDYWWIDAGWYPCGADWGQVGTWEPAADRYPKGLREVADHVHAKGMKFIVWFEPERVAGGTFLAEKHPDWVLGGKQGGLLNLGNSAARQWLTDHTDRLITTQGIDLYRQDFNMEPLPYWRGNDTPDRQGITENHHVEGYLAYWDELRRRHPRMPIDSCASGGRRNDLETLRRAVPLLRSDYRFEPTGTQGHTYGMASWIPYFGTGVTDTTDYVVRSHWCPCLGIGRPEPRRPGLDWTQYRRRMDEWRKATEYMLGDYYPLNSYSLDNATWIAWQFDLPERGRGMIQAYRRSESPYESARFALHGLEPDGRYVVSNLDGGPAQKLTGRELTEHGLLLKAPTRDSAIVMFYEKQQ